MSYDADKSPFSKTLGTPDLSLKRNSSVKSENRERARKLIKDALSGAQGASQTSPVGVQQENFELKPLSPLGDFASDLGPTGQTDATRGQEPDSNGTQGLDSRFSNNIERMMRDAPGGLSITSGRRDTQRQAELWQNALQKYGDEATARKWVAPPTGHRMSDGSVARGSRHESGLAADLSYASDETKRWVHQNAHRYGLHFPLSNEDWHVEPLGSRN